jgi:hypothetical protein
MQLTPQNRARAITTLRLIGAIALLMIGAVHLEQYSVDDYRVIPTIGPLFLVNFIAGTVLGLYLLVTARGSDGRLRRTLDLVAAWSGLAVAAGALLALLIAERTPLFGFMEQGYRLAIVLAIGAEAVAILALTAFLALAPPVPRMSLGTSPFRHGPAGEMARRRSGTR